MLVIFFTHIRPFSVVYKLVLLFHWNCPFRWNCHVSVLTHLHQNSLVSFLQCVPSSCCGTRAPAGPRGPTPASLRRAPAAAAWRSGSLPLVLGTTRPSCLYPQCFVSPLPPGTWECCASWRCWALLIFLLLSSSAALRTPGSLVSLFMHLVSKKKSLLQTF